MVVWHTFLPFGLSIAICVFISWKSMENQLELRESGGRRCGAGDGGEGEDKGDENTSTTTTIRLGPYTHRPPKTASELRARLQTLSRLPPGPRRRAKGRALALAAEHALREASPELASGRGEENDDEGADPDLVVVKSRGGSRAAALRQTLPWLDARLAALASEDAAAERCGACEICAGHEDACATHAWPCGGHNGGGGGGGQDGSGGGGGEEGGGIFAALFGSNSSSSSLTAPPNASSSSVYTTSAHRACGRCSAKWGARCPFCRREGAARLAFLEAQVS